MIKSKNNSEHYISNESESDLEFLIISNHF